MLDCIGDDGSPTDGRDKVERDRVRRPVDPRARGWPGEVDEGKESEQHGKDGAVDGAQDGSKGRDLVEALDP